MGDRCPLFMYTLITIGGNLHQKQCGLKERRGKSRSRKTNSHMATVRLVYTTSNMHTTNGLTLVLYGVTCCVAWLIKYIHVASVNSAVLSFTVVFQPQNPSLKEPLGKPTAKPPCLCREMVLIIASRQNVTALSHRRIPVS